MNYLKSIALSGAILAAACAPASVFAQSTLPPVAEYIIPSEMAGQDKSGFLDSLTEAVRQNPRNAPDIVRSALRFKIREIEQTPGLATEIVMAVIAGLPTGTASAGTSDFKGVRDRGFKDVAMSEDERLDLIARVLDAATSVLRGLPIDLSYVANEVILSVLASLSPEDALIVRNDILQGPQGALRNESAAIFTVLPTGGSGAIVNPNDQNDGRQDQAPEDDQPVRPPVTPVTPQALQLQ